MTLKGQSPGESDFKWLNYKHISIQLHITAKLWDGGGDQAYSQTGMWLIIHINTKRKSYTCIETSIAPLRMTLSDLEWSNSRLSIFEPYISLNSRVMAYITLILNTNRKSYMGGPIALLDLTLSELERSKSRLTLRNWEELGDRHVFDC